MSEATFDVDRPTRLITLDRQGLAAQVLQLRVREAGGSEPDRVTLRIRVDHATWRVIIEGGWFNTDPRLGVGSVERAGFETDRPIDLELGLRPAVAGTFMGDTDLAGVLFSDQDDAGLRQTESWRLLSAVQQVDLPDGMDGSVSMGMQTAWNEPPPAPAMGMIQVVIQGLAARGWAAERLYEDMFRVVMDEQGHAFDLYVRADEKLGICAAYSAFPTPVPQARLAEANVSLMALTRTLEVGALELDLEDGEIRLRTGIDIGAGELPPLLFDRLVTAHVQKMHEAWDSLAALTS